MIDVTKKLKPISPPEGMPHRFRWQNKEFHWYQTLRRRKKYYMIRIYRDHSREIEIIDEFEFKPTKVNIFSLHFAAPKQCRFAGESRKS